MKLEIACTTSVAQNIRIVQLRSTDGLNLPAFEPGAHIVIHVKMESGEDVRREYSLTGSPECRATYEIAVQAEPAGRGGSLAVHNLKVKDTVEVSGPINQFPLVLDAPSHLLIAGGIGITPLVNMARQLNRTGREVELHYAASSSVRMAFVQELAELPNVTFYCRDLPGYTRMPLESILATPKEGLHVYVCGPSRLISAVVELSRANGWPSEQIHFESFAGPLKLVGDRPIRVTLAQSGRIIEVAASETILDALSREGVDPLADCRRGECGMCVVDVLSGVPDHRDSALTEREKKSGKRICTCVSRAISDELVIDI